ncbi:DMT family transporter [Pseudonocardia sp. DLS-67]
MQESSILFVAVPAAVVGAASFGLASVLQHRATKLVATSRTLDPRLLVRLARRPVWVLSIGTVVAGLALQVVALAFGPIVLVQPLLVTGVLFGAVFSALLAHRRVDRMIVLGALACVAGLAAFLLLARPSGGTGTIEDGAEVLPLALALGVLVLVALIVAGRFGGPPRVLALAIATGVLYGVTAGLIKVVTAQIRTGGITEPFHHPVLYVVCLVGPAGFLLSQNTFQQGALVAPALAVITVVDPVVGIAVGVGWLGEQVVTTPLVLAGEAFAGAVAIAGIAVLAHRGTVLRHEIEQRSYSPPPTWG